MPQIKCPNCGRVRLVVEGKKKNCRKCGTPLTTNPPKEQKPIKVTAEQLQEQHPEQIAEIINAAKNEVVREETGELTTEILTTQYPELVEELVAAARENAAGSDSDDKKIERHVHVYRVTGKAELDIKANRKRAEAKALKMASADKLEFGESDCQYLALSFSEETSDTPNEPEQ